MRSQKDFMDMLEFEKEIPSGARKRMTRVWAKPFQNIGESDRSSGKSSNRTSHKRSLEGTERKKVQPKGRKRCNPMGVRGLVN